MIILKLKGGLGNQMFQYAFGRFLSVKNKDILKIDIQGLQETSKDTQRKYLLDKFNTVNEEASPEEILPLKYPLGIISKGMRFLNSKILRKFYINFEPKLLNLKGNIYLEGFFQSEKYFKEIEDIIREEFTLKKSFSKFANDISFEIIEAIQPVSIHIRRGDYVLNAKTNKQHGTCSIEYYEKAIDQIKKRFQSPKFFIFSDDIEWAKKNIKIENVRYVSNPSLGEYEELVLMSKCDHNIIANSTFSWWAAWLNENPEKIVISPKNWTSKLNSNKLGILPKSWIQI